MTRLPTRSANCRWIPWAIANAPNASARSSASRGKPHFVPIDDAVACQPAQRAGHNAAQRLEDAVGLRSTHQSRRHINRILCGASPYHGPMPIVLPVAPCNTPAP